jgi:hypothetical protein
MLTSIAGKLTSRCQKLDRMQLTSEGRHHVNARTTQVAGGEDSVPPFSFFAYSFVG